MEAHLKELGLDYSYNMWLLVKFDGLALLQPANKKVVVSFSYVQLEKATALCSSIQLTIAGKSLRVNTDQAYEISNMVAVYQQLNREIDAL
jgi:hypothetical protein